MAGVEVGGDGFRGEDADAVGQAAVERAVEAVGRDGGGQGERGDLAEGVDAGVGTAGTLGEDALAEGAMDGIGERALDGRQAGLHLPPVKPGTVVGERELPVRHGRDLHGNTVSQL